MFAKIFMLSARRKRFSPWGFGLKLGFLVAVVVWWWLQNEDGESKSAKEDRIILTIDDEVPPIPKKAAPKPKAKPKAIEPDDLTQVDGIGPKYALVLNEAGVKTFAQLASMDSDAVREIFRATGGRAPDPSGWIEQAASLK